MTDPADRHLEERLHAMARGVTPPVVPLDADVRRGRRRLFRMRAAMGGATVATLAVVLGITGLTAGDPTASTIEPAPPVPRTTLPASPEPSDDAAEDEKERVPGGSTARTGGPGKADSGGAAPSTTTATGLGGKGGVVGAPPDPGTDGSPASYTQSDGPADHGFATADPTTPATPTDTSTPTTPGTPTPTGPTSPPSTPPTDVPTPPPTTPPSDKVRVHQVLKAYNDVLAEHLDPDRDHLVPYDRKTGNKETTKIGGLLFALGSKYAWQDGRGTAALRISVASGWDQVEWGCGASYSDWSCHDGGSGETTRSEVAIHDGIRQVAVEHAGGQVVVLTADPTYDDGSKGVSSGGGSEEDLLAAAADDRLTLPGVVPMAPQELDLDAFEAAGESALVLPKREEAFALTSVDRSPEVQGDWSVADVAHGTLSWSAEPVYSGAGWECLKQYRSCSEVVVDGVVVHLGKVRPRAGGGWVVGYDGPSYAVRVYASDKTFPKKRAFPFVTSPEWQPVR